MRLQRKLLALLLGAFITVGIMGGLASAAPAGIFTGDHTPQLAYVDPVVSPGERSAHEHAFCGAHPVHTVETSAELLTHATTFDVQTKHTVLIWPSVYENGRLLPQFSQHGCLLYYQTVPGTECVPPPNMAGISREYGWRGQVGGGSFSAAPPATSQDGALVLMVQFRGGRDFGVSCFPDVRAFIRFNVGAGPIGHITVGGPVLGVDGAREPTTAHGDYMFADDRAAFERFLAACVRPGRACGRNPTP